MARVIEIAAFASALFAAYAARGDAENAPGYRPAPVRVHAARRAATAAAKTAASAPGLLGAASSIPSSWDSRDHGWITPVKNQGDIGCCWAFSANAVIETQLLMAGRGTHDLSEKNMANLHGFGWGYNAGGNNEMAAAHLLRWGGAVAESNDVYQTTASAWKANPSVPMNPAVRIQNVVWIPARTSPEDNDAFKRAVMDYGAVSVGFRYESGFEGSKGAYYCGAYTNAVTNTWSNHAVTLVGWDDSYSASNFRTKPPGDGAWLIKNSWGAYRGDSGYLHVSYHDRTAFYALDDGAVFVPATDEEDYSAVYGYDRFGPIDFLDEGDTKCTLQAATFVSAWNEDVAAVGVWTALDAAAPYAVSVYTNVTPTAENPVAGGRLARSQSGTLSHAGYTTIPLSEPVPLADGTRFTVVYEQTGSRLYHATTFTCVDGKGNLYSDYGEIPEGRTWLGEIESRTFYKRTVVETNWCDAATSVYEDGAAIVCLKAYTRSTASASDSGAGETDDGSGLLADMAATNSVLYAETGRSFGAVANLVGANGRTLYASWLAGFNPSVATDNALRLDISVLDGEVRLGWKPDLGSARSYTVWGADALGPGATWRVVGKDAPAATGAKFFKVSVGQ